MTPEDTWPDHLRAIPRHVHAIGALSINFNDLENKLLGLLKLYDGAPDDVVSFLFEKLPTETRLAWLERLVAARKLRPPHLQKCIAAFATAYQTCVSNRNLIVHSRIQAHWVGEDTLMMSKRTRSRGQERHHDFSLEVIRRVADETLFWNGFGSHVLHYALRKQRIRQKKYKRPGVTVVGPTTLPKIPPLPKALATLSQS